MIKDNFLLKENNFTSMSNILIKYSSMFYMAINMEYKFLKMGKVLIHNDQYMFPRMQLIIM